MADLWLQSVDVGTPGEVSAACVPLSCPLCGSTVRPLARDDPRGYSVRERRLVVRCNSTEGCRWQGVLVVELVDIPAKDRTFRRAS